MKHGDDPRILSTTTPLTYAHGFDTKTNRPTTLTYPEGSVVRMVSRHDDAHTNDAQDFADSYTRRRAGVTLFRKDTTPLDIVPVQFLADPTSKRRYIERELLRTCNGEPPSRHIVDKAWESPSRAKRIRATVDPSEQVEAQEGASAVLQAGRNLRRTASRAEREPAAPLPETFRPRRHIRRTHPHHEPSSNKPAQFDRSRFRNRGD